LETKTKYVAQEDGGWKIVIPLMHPSKNLRTQDDVVREGGN